MKASDARQNFSQVLNDVFRGEKRVLVEKSGIPVAGIVSARDLERLRDLDEQRERDFAVIDVIRDAFANVPDEEIEREVARAVASARRKRRPNAGQESQPE
ncbi:MAG TPA: type II toxin-antitoxin system prevent-host-death family antitoxin [Chloroflexota bacterium]|nr:type II toxin-antitoxin system prevent-host-death family antitoxin [Chloroflexota bacterium]